MGIEATAAAMIGPEDVVLNLVSGIYGRVFGQLAGRFARESSRSRPTYSGSIAPAAVSARPTRRKDVTIVSVVHCGHRPAPMNDLTPSRGSRGRAGRCSSSTPVSSFAGMPTDSRAGRHRDQPRRRALGGPPGLSLLHASADAYGT